MSIVTASDGMDRYKRLEKLGEGTYGLVYKAQDLEENKFVAIKKIKLDNNEEGIPATTMREISLLSHLKHPNIIPMDGCLYVNGELYLVFEFMSCDLKGYIDGLSPNRYLDLITLKKFTYFLTEGIRFCHTRRILHRDLKPQNILVSNDKHLKIADFGLGREHGLPIGELTHEVVTLWYRPPEILLGKKKYSGACDVWGIGCIFAEMATKIPLFPGDSEIDQLFQIYRILGTPTEKTWPGISELPDYTAVGPKWRKKDLYRELNGKLDKDGVALLEQMLVYVPNKRITAKQILADAWFDEIREGMIEIFGNQYPHCGSREYQLQKWQKQQDLQNKENMDSINDGVKRKRRRMNHDHKKNINDNDNHNNKNNKMNQDHIHDDTDYDDDDDYNDQEETEGDEEEEEEEEYDDDDDITGNAEEWNQNRNDSNLSQPMDEDNDEEE